MSFLFKLILVLIFIYLIYRIAVYSRIPKDHHKGEDNVNNDTHTDNKSVQKKIDMSDVEDADYKEIK